MKVKKGDTIELVEMPNDPRPVKVGEKGIVQFVSIITGDFTQIGVNWESGRRLMLCVPPDKFKIVTSESEVRK